ncbi:MAG: hypothetical protein WDM70_09390 [Nitrosomonadales bacterium]
MPPAVELPTVSATKNNAVPPPTVLNAVEKEEVDVDEILEEARLYATLGRTARAAEILQEITKLYPFKAEAWPLLLSIYSSLGKSAEFEKAALEFLKHHKDSPSWRGIQALGTHI